MPSLVTQILKRLQRPGSSALELLQAYQNGEHQKFWNDDPSLYRAFARKLIDDGHPTRAFELAREGLAVHPNDPALRHFLALALANGGNLSNATGYVNELLHMTDLSPELKVETLALQGRIFKERHRRSKDAGLRHTFARQAAECYQSAHEISETETFAGINAATMFLLIGDHHRAGELASLVMRRANSKRQKKGGKSDYWLSATLGEASLLQGDVAEAGRWYVDAIRSAIAQNAVGAIAAMRRNFQLLKQKLELSDELWSMFDVGSVVVFSGHMIDHPARPTKSKPTARFPADAELERRVSNAIKTGIEHLNATVGYCCAACGSDILFAERMLERNAELHIVLPFDKDDFYDTSVDFGLAEMKGWRARFDAVVARATEVHYATVERYLEDDVLFDFVTSVMQGLALIHGMRRGVEPHALVVHDPAASSPIGGTGYFIAKWSDLGRETTTIDLQDLRAGIPVRPVGRSPKLRAVKTSRDGTIKRHVKAMLFADVKDFSQLREDQSPQFFLKFLDEVHAVLTASQNAPAFTNTWGDGLYAVFDRVTDCADFALRLLERAEKVEWAKLGFSEMTPVRIGLHAGPVYNHMDPVIKRNNFFGSHVNRAARIEPVTIPGCAFTSEQFAALLVAEPKHDFICEYIGIEHLAKRYDRCPLYRLGRR